MGAQTVYLALPRRPGEEGPNPEKPGTISVVQPAQRGYFKAGIVRCSLLNLAFNRCWANALNGRKEYGTTHFAMQHSDIIPIGGWCDVLIDEMDRNGADVCSAVVPIKDSRGLTSTGIRNGGTGDTRRLTMSEVFQLPETFTVEDLQEIGIHSAGREHSVKGDFLAINTGLWVCRFTEAWAEPPIFPGFMSCDQIRRMDDGRAEAVCLPEDWAFSEWAYNHGLKVCATRKAPLVHFDGPASKTTSEYRNDHVWGEWQTDQGDLPKV